MYKRQVRIALLPVGAGGTGPAVAVGGRAQQRLRLLLRLRAFVLRLAVGIYTRHEQREGGVHGDVLVLGLCESEDVAVLHRMEVGGLLHVVVFKDGVVRLALFEDNLEMVAAEVGADRVIFPVAEGIFVLLLGRLHVQFCIYQRAVFQCLSGEGVESVAARVACVGFGLEKIVLHVFVLIVFLFFCLCVLYLFAAAARRRYLCCSARACLARMRHWRMYRPRSIMLLPP